MTPAVSTIYSVTVTSGSLTQVSSVSVEVKSLPIVSWSTSLPAVCVSSTSYSLSGGSPAGGTYSGPGVSGSILNASLAGTGLKTLTYTYTNPGTGCSNSVTNTIMINSLPTVSWISSLASQCVSSTIYSLSGGIPSGGTYSGSGVSGTNFNASVAGAGIKILTYSYTDLSGCVNTASNSITVNALPVVSWTNLLMQQCANNTTYVLTGGSPSGGTYTGAGVSGTNFNASVAGTGLKVLTYTYTDIITGCTNSVTNTILVNSVPGVFWSNTLSPQCTNSTVYTLTGGSPVGGTYSGLGVSGNNFNASLAGTGTITLTYSYTNISTGCSNSVTNSLVVNVLPAVSWTNILTPQCVNNSSYTLTGGAPSGGTYGGIGVIGNNFNSSIAGVGNKTLSYSFTNPSTGCINTTNNVITVNALPVVSWPNTLTPQCVNSTVYLLTGGSPTGGTYSGSGVSATNFNASVAGTGNKTLTYTYTDPGTSCTASTTNTIVVNPLPTVSWPNSLTAQCVNSTIFVLSGATPSGGTYSGTGVTGSNFNASLAGIGTHTITYTYLNPVTGCSNSVTNTIIVNSLPNVTWTTLFPVQCLFTAPFTLSGANPTGGTYSGPGVSGTSFNPAIAGVGTHTLTYAYTNANGCTKSVQNTIVVKTTPPAAGNITGLSLVCPGATNTVYQIPSSPNINSYSWWVIGSAVIASGQGTNQISVNFTGTGNVSINVMGVNECGSGLVSSPFVVTISPVMIADAGPADSITYGFSTILQGSVTGGTPPYSYSWTPATGLSNSNIATPTASPLVTTVYTLHVSDAGNCSSTDSTRIAVSPAFGASLSGVVTYNGIPTLPLGNVQLFLKQNNIVKYQTISNSNGEYSFAGILPGVYKLSGKKQFIYDPNGWDGINAIDALINASHFVGLIQLTGIRLIAADVDASGYVNSNDGFFTLKKFVRLIDSFPAGHWVIDTCTIAISGNVIKNLEALNVGDVNGSMTNPYKQESSNISMNESGLLAIPQSGIFEVPVTLNERLNIGATSLIINYPTDKFVFAGIKSPVNSENFAYSEKDGEIRLGWYTTEGIVVEKGDVLVNLQFELRNSVISLPEEQMFNVTSESVISDPFANEYSMVNLLIPHLTLNSSIASQIYIIGNTPNPYSDKTSITYQLAEEGIVGLTIFNSTGDIVAQPIKGEFNSAGIHSLEFDGSRLAQGTYWYLIDFRNSKTFITKSNKMIITR